MRRSSWRRSKGVQRGKVPTRSGEMGQRIAGRRGTDARQKLQHAEASDRIFRILDPPQDAQHIFEMCRFKELQPAVFDEWDAAAPEFNLELVAMVAGAEQHGLSFQVNSCLAMLQDTLDYIVDLGCFIARDDQLGPFSRRLVRKELFAKSFGCLCDHRVSCFQNRLRRAVVLLERDDVGRRRELLWEIKNGPYCRGSG